VTAWFDGVRAQHFRRGGPIVGAGGARRKQGSLGP
jgi:hypothetical protein